MTTYRTAGGKTYTLQSSVSSTQTTLTLTSFKVPVSGDDLTMALMSTSVAYGTIAPRTSQSEFISFTGITQNADGTATLTGVTRGLNKTFPYTEDTDFKLPHAGATQFILSDAPQVFNQYAALVNDNTWTGQQTFPQSGTASAALVGAVYAAPTQDTEVASKKYVDDTASFGAPLATTTTAGIIELPTNTELEAGTNLGGTGAGLVVMNQQYGARKILGYNRTTGSANAYTLDLTNAPTAYATGQKVGFTASFANTGNATVNVSGLGAKNLFLASTGLFSGAIATDAYIGAVYDGTVFEITEGSDLISTAASANTIGFRRSTGDMTVPTTPTNSTDATSKAYVDSLGTGFIGSGAPGTTTTNTTANVATISIVGGTLSTNKALRIRVTVQAAISATNNGATYTMTYGGTTVGTFGYTGSSGTPTVTGLVVTDIVLVGAGTTGTQKANVTNFFTTTSGGGGTTATPIVQTNSLSVDSTVSQNLLISCTAGASVTGTLIDYLIEKVT